VAGEQHELVSQVTAMNNALSQFSAFFQGSAANAFGQTLQGWHKSADGLMKMLDGLATYLNKTADIIQQQDEGLGRTIGGTAPQGPRGGGGGSTGWTPPASSGGGGGSGPGHRSPGQPPVDSGLWVQPPHVTPNPEVVPPTPTVPSPGPGSGQDPGQQPPVAPPPDSDPEVIRIKALLDELAARHERFASRLQLLDRRLVWEHDNVSDLQGEHERLVQLRDRLATAGASPSELAIVDEQVATTASTLDAAEASVEALEQRRTTVLDELHHVEQEYADVARLIDAPPLEHGPTLTVGPVPGVQTPVPPPSPDEPRVVVDDPVARVLRPIAVADPIWLFDDHPDPGVRTGIAREVCG
jgi:uncharacterized protein YukE